MDTAKKNVAVLAICQGLLLVNNSILITVNALAGYALATDKALAYDEHCCGALAGFRRGDAVLADRAAPGTGGRMMRSLNYKA